MIRQFRWMFVLVTLAASPSLLTAQHAVAVDAALVPDKTRAADEILARPITIRLHGISLDRAIDTIARVADARIGYRPSLLARYSGLVDVTAINVALKTVLERALHGTALVVVPGEEGRLVVVEDTRLTGGEIAGIVVDAATKRPVEGVAIRIERTKSEATSDGAGAFHIAGIPAGHYRVVVRRLGYLPYTTTIDVTEGRSTSLTVALTSAATRLSEVVTTATGPQRRVDVGNVIAHLDVDSLARLAPATSLTDLLSARATGVQVIATNGLVGAGSAIRIRGQSSVLLAGDPIVIVDGIRQDNRAGGTPAIFGSMGDVATPSRLNDLDVSQIATIDILKGPAASTEYGTDAANGVIVITTKRGRPGAARWRVAGERGWSGIPVGFEDSFYSWGHTTDGMNTPTQCPLTPVFGGSSVVDSTCVVDSTTHYNPLNHAATSLFRPGIREAGDVSLNGGGEAVRYYLAGSVAQDVGTTQLPRVFRAQAATLGVPASALEPNTQQQHSARANLTARLNPALDVDVTSAYFTTRQQAPSAPSFLYAPYTGASIPDSAHNYGYGADLSSSPLAALGALSTEATTRVTAGGHMEWQPAAWFHGHATTGIDHDAQRQQMLFTPQAYQIAYGVPDRGQLSVFNGETDVRSGDVRGALSLPVRPTVRSVTSLGLQFASTHGQGVRVSASTGITETNGSLNGVANPSVTQSGDAAVTVGGYLEQQVGLAERLFLIGAVRLDGASGFGADHHVTAYPKLSVSWLAYDNGGTTVRLRSAFGAAGQQPANGSAQQLYFATVAYADGVAASGSTLLSPGNPTLKPERSGELEGGFDVSLWANRINVEFTGYVKHTRDALVTIPLGWDFGAGIQVQQNLGDVRNTGVEATVQATLLQTRATTWSATLNASSNHNKLLTLAPNVPSNNVGNNQRQVPGYPLWGFWAPRATYADADGNGLITADEIAIADTASYVGASIPTVETSLATQLALLRGAVTLGALVDARVGGKVYDRGPVVAAQSGTARAQNDPAAPFRDQALAALAGASYFSPVTSLQFADGSFVRLRELSLLCSVPERWARPLRASTMGVALKVRNLGLWSHLGHGDPEVGSSLGNSRGNFGGGVPLPRTWLLSVTFGF